MFGFIPHPESGFFLSGSATKNISIFNPKNFFQLGTLLSSRKYDPVPIFIPRPRYRLFLSRIQIQGSKRHRIPDPHHESQYRFYLWIKEGDEGEGPEGLRYEDVCDLPEFGEVLLEVLTRHLLRAPAHEYLAWHLLHLNTYQRYSRRLGCASGPGRSW
jgi:hypothetical protein